MRRNLQRLMVVMAAMMICLGASAIDKVVKKATLTGEVTSMEDLKASTFLLANGEGTETVVLYTPSGWDIKVASPSTAVANTGNGGFYKLEEFNDNYLIPVFNFDKSVRTYWAGNQYVNSQPAGGNVIFGLAGTNDQHGQDGPNLAVWTIAYEAGQGFTFHCVGREIYIGHDGTAARPVEAVTYWKAYTGFEVAFDAAEVEASAKAVEAALKTSDAKTAYNDAKGVYEADKEAEGALDKYVAAINAAIDVINTCEQVNKAYANYKLSTLGAAAVKDVVAKYNAGEYKDVAALSAAYVEAVKAQNCDGADMTGAIINPSFELGTKEGWTSDNCGDVATNYNFGGRTGDKFCERWQGSGGLSNGKFYQALTGLPNGTYKITADLQNREQGNGDAAGTGFFVFANDDRTEGLDANNGKTIEVTTEITDGNLTLGVQLDGCSGNWICFDNFTLTLVKAADAIVPEKDAWYTGVDFFRFRADKNAAAESPYYAWKDKVEPVWGAAAGEETNGCIVCKVPANVDPASQIWIRGTEAGKTIANGSKEGFKVTFRVKADGEYTLESQAHNNWGYKTGGNPFGPLNVTTEWQTVTFICTGEAAKNDFTDLCFNLSGDAERTIYFDDVQIVRGSEWYLNNEFHAKDYKNPAATYADGNDPHPVARYVADAEGGYVEVISNAGGDQTYNSQLWIAIPAEFVGASTLMTMEVQASKAIKTPESFQATATGNGWGCNPGPGSGVDFTVGEWTTITRVLNTTDMKSTGTWRDLQADQYCLDLTEKLDGNAGEAITYKFRNVEFKKAAEDWYYDNTIKIVGDKDKAPYTFGDGAEGGYVEVDGGKTISFEIPENLRGAEVEVLLKVKATEAGKVGDIDFTTEWTDASVVFDATEATAYELALPAGDAKYDFDELSFKKYFAPVVWGDLVEASADGELIGEKDWTAATSYSGWSGDLPAGYTREVENGLVLVNTSDAGNPWDSQFEVINGLSNLKAGAKYSVRLTMKIDGEGDLQVNFGDWGTTQQYLQTLEKGYRQVVWEFPSWASDVASGVHALFQGRKFVGRIILEKVEVFEDYIDPATLDWSENILNNGDLSTNDMSEFILKNNDVENPEMLLAEKNEYGEIGIETAALPEEGGNDYDAQFFVRLPKVLPKGTKFNLEFDLYAEHVNTLTIAAHGEPGEWKANISSVKTDPSLDAVHYQEYLTAPADMRTIAFNLAVADATTYGFSNIKVQYVNDDEAAIEEATQTADATTLWAETLALNEACYAGRITETEGYTAESVKALTDAIAAGKAALAPAEGDPAPTKESLTAAAKAITDAIAGLKKDAPALAYTDLTKEMFFHWNAADETAEPIEASNCDFNIGTSTGQPYGLSTVNHDRFADLSAYNTIELTATEGEPRLLFNRIENEGTVFAEVPRDKDKYETVVDNGDGSKTYVIDIAAIVAEYGFAHLHAIKGANWANTTVTEIKLGYAGEKPALPIPTAIEGVETAEDALQDGKYFINGQIVIVKNGVKYNAAGVAIK